MAGSLPPRTEAGPTPQEVATNQAQPQNTVRIPWSPGRFVIWAGAIAVLWFILTVLADSGNADVARALGGLLVFGALVTLGPGAIGNAKGLVR